MADNGKKYYWLKLKENFFRDKEIKKLRKIAGGDTLTIIYLKMMLASLRDNGRLHYEGVEDSFYEELALELDEDPENVKLTVLYLQKVGLIQEISEAEAFLTQIPECIGSETAKAELMRKSRARKRVLESGNNVTAALPRVTECSPEIDIEIEKDIDIENKRETGEAPPGPAPDSPAKEDKPKKHKHGEYNNVLLSDQELKKLQEEYQDWAARIERLSAYIASTGKRYKSHYATIRNWASRDAATERSNKPGRKEIVPDWMDKPKASPLAMAAVQKMLAEDNLELAARAEELKKRIHAE